MRIAFALFLMCTSALAQQQMLPLTDWRAQIDYELARVPMTREAHTTIFNILQAYERQAQAQKHASPPSVPEQK